MTIGVIDHDCCWCGCALTITHDDAHTVVIIQHGTNPEAVLIFPESRVNDMEDVSVSDEAYAWLHAIHTYEDKR